MVGRLALNRPTLDVPVVRPLSVLIMFFFLYLVSHCFYFLFSHSRCASSTTPRRSDRGGDDVRQNDDGDDDDADSHSMTPHIPAIVKVVG